jgi:RND family efflux transporter MFP subunit
MASGSMTTLVRLLDLHEVEVSVRVAERDLPRVAVGSPLVATVAGVEGTFQGTVARVAFEIDSATQTGEVLARIPNPDRRLIAGMFTTVRIEPRSTREALRVPQQSVVEIEGTKYVFVVENGHVRKQRVQTAPSSDERLEIVEGIRPGMVVATSGVDRLEDGDAVTVEAATSANAQAAATRSPPTTAAEQAPAEEATP